MTQLHFLLPTLGAFIGVLSVLITYYCLWRTLEKNKTKIIQSLTQRLDSVELQGEFHKILDDKIDNFIENLRNQIPMGPMLLTHSLSLKIKGIAKEEILKQLPDIKERLLTRFTQETRIEIILWRTFRSELYRIIIYNALLGFLFGLLWLLIIFLVGIRQ